MLILPGKPWSSGLFQFSERISQGSISAEVKAEVYQGESTGVNVGERALRRKKGHAGLYLLITFV